MTDKETLDATKSLIELIERLPSKMAITLPCCILSILLFFAENMRAELGVSDITANRALAVSLFALTMGLFQKCGVFIETKIKKVEAKEDAERAEARAKEDAERAETKAREEAERAENLRYREKADFFNALPEDRTLILGNIKDGKIHQVPNHHDWHFFCKNGLVKVHDDSVRGNLLSVSINEDILPLIQGITPTLTPSSCAKKLAPSIIKRNTF
jgi:hypothetical protein